MNVHVFSGPHVNTVTVFCDGFNMLFISLEGL